MTSSLSILRTYWGYQSFRGLQSEIIDAVVSGEDVVALLPTGGGKTICYQVPALMKPGLCLVISPLVALMKDQVDTLIDKGIDAAMLNNSMNYSAIKQTLIDASEGNYKFLYVSPERLKSNLFRENIAYLNIQLIAVDEAHCISQWGYDFRPSYLSIAEIRDYIKKVPIIAVTASATKIVQADITHKLQLRNPVIFQQSFVRAQLSYSVFEEPDKMIKVLDILGKVPGTSIVYCRSRLDTQEMSASLQSKGIKADHYHAGLSHQERSKKQQQWMHNETRVMVATNAFGMGIDKADVRTVIHTYVPDCIESYYQEAGRAGRDEKKAYAVMIFNDKDQFLLSLLSDIRYPPVSQIKEVYQSLVNYLQIAVGSGEGHSFDFSLEYFIKHFNQEINLVINVLKILEQEGHIVFSESVITPSKIQFTASREEIETVAESYPELGEVIRALMRSYSGILENSVFVFENQIATSHKINVNELIKGFHKLEALDIIEYLPKKNTPQILFLQNRSSASQLQINTTQYFERKKRFEERLAHVKEYLYNKTTCRSLYIASYFDAPIPNCGVCDNCLNKKKQVVDDLEFVLIKESIIQGINDNGTDIVTILQHNHFPKYKFWKVFQYLENQRIIQTNDGKVEKLKHPS